MDKTCKSSENLAFGPGESGERVSNTWVICLGAWDNLGKLGLIPHNVLVARAAGIKGPQGSLGEGAAAD